jgi:FkbM family methyltransferase
VKLAGLLCAPGASEELDGEAQRLVTTVSDDREWLRQASASGIVTLEDVINLIYTDVVRPGDVVVDGGAHGGLHTFPLSRLVGPTGRVIAVEALPNLATALREQAGAKGARNVEVVAGALYHEHTTVSFHAVQTSLAWSGIERQARYPWPTDVEVVPVTTVLLDDLIEGAWRFAKLDLEGGEFRALQGARQAIERCSPMLIFERSMGAPLWYGYSLDDFYGFFAEVGYGVYDLFGEPLPAAEWTDPRHPPDALAVRIGGRDERYVRHSLPRLLSEFTAWVRHSIGEEAARPAGPLLTATPNPVPAGSDAGVTTVRWDTRDGSDGEITLAAYGSPERVWARGSSGTQQANWINAWGVYVFRLYRVGHRRQLLDSIRVSRKKSPIVPRPAA